MAPPLQRGCREVWGRMQAPGTAGDAACGSVRQAAAACAAPRGGKCGRAVTCQAVDVDGGNGAPTAPPSAPSAPSSNVGTASGGIIIATSEEDTIVAIVTGAATPSSSVSIIRVSGTDALQVAGSVFWPGGKFKFGWRPKDHAVHYGVAVDGDGNVIDEVLLLAMLSPKSYTCEDVIEIHTHGGGVCAQRVLTACIEAGARPARPGEFTLRAFLNGRLDLSQAENVLSLLQARTAAAADSALAGVRSGVGAAVSDMRDDCIRLLAELEARIDFDEDMPDMDSERLASTVEQLQCRIEDALRTARASSLLRQGLQVAIVGRPNVGKSSLLNAWTRSARAIVTDVAGTTRDVLEAPMVVGGVPVTLLDTAGIRTDTSDVVERIGVERSRAAAAAADIVMMVVDAQAGWTDEDAEIFKGLWGEGVGTRGCAVKGLSLLVANKHDLAAGARNGNEDAAAGAGRGTDAEALSASAESNLREGSDGSTPAAAAPGPPASDANGLRRDLVRSHLDLSGNYTAGSSSSDGGGGGGGSTRRGIGGGSATALRLPLLVRDTFEAVVHTSATKRTGLEELDRALLSLAGAPQLAGSGGGMSWAVNERQADALVCAHGALMRVAGSIKEGLPIDFWTIDTREAIIALGEVTGDEVTEQVLDSVFSQFCIGK